MQITLTIVILATSALRTLTTSFSVMFSTACSQAEADAIAEVERSGTRAGVMGLGIATTQLSHASTKRTDVRK